jgi:hypothetical protein
MLTGTTELPEAQFQQVRDDSRLNAANNQPLLVERFRGLSQYSSTAVLEKDAQLKIGSEKVHT